MKKSTRLLALLLAVIMIMSTMSVLSSAASPYKYTGSEQAEGDASGLVYDDADTLSLTTEQYATMAVDEIDRMLKEEFSEPIDIAGMIELNVSGIDAALGSVKTIVNSATALSSLIGTDGTGLINALNKVVNISRHMSPEDNGWAVDNDNYHDDSSESDLLVLYAVLDLLGCKELGDIIDHYIYDNGINLDLGSLGGLIEAYKFDVRQIAMSALIKVAEVYDNPDFRDSTGAVRDDWDIIDDYAKVPSVYTQVGTPENHYSTGALLIANQALVKLVLGDWTKLDPSKVYSATNKTCEVVWSDYYWKDADLNPIPETDPDYAEPNWSRYDYYCYIHEDGLVTAGLGDAIRVEKGTADPTNGAGSYSAVNLAEIKTSIKNKSMEGYDYIENLAVQAYNSIAVPLLNRSVVQWLRKEAGFVFLDSKKTKYKKFTKDTTINGKTYKAGEDMRDANGNKVISDTYDYCYLGEDYKKEGYTADHLMEIFNTEDIKIKRYVPVAGETFVQNLNKTLEGVVEQALIVDQNEVLTRKADDGVTDIEASWSWTTCDNTEENEFADNGNLFKNVCSLVRFILKYTENDFFDSYSISRGEIWSAAQIDENALLAASDDAEESHGADVSLVAYLLRVIINSSTNETYIEPEEGETIASVAYQIAEQFVRQSVPQLMYTKPDAGDYSSTAEYDRALLDKALFMLVDLAAYSLGNTMDLNIDAQAEGTHNINDGTADNNNTGLLPYLGSGAEGSTDNEYTDEDGYKSTANIIAKWALKNYAPLFTFYEIGDENDKSKAQFWKIIDTLINNIIPLRRINANTPGWLDESIDNNKTEDTFIEEVLINYLIMPILELDNTGKIFQLFSKGNDTQFSYQGDNPSMDLEGVIVKVLGLIFNDLFYGSFDDVAMVDLDTVINNNNLAGFLKRLLASLGAHSRYEGKFNGNTVWVTGRGKQILYVGLPVAAMILGLADKQEFSELENYITDVIKPAQTKQTLYNGSTGLNTSYMDNTGTRYVDCLYNFEITAKTQTDLTTGTSGTISLAKTTLAGGEMVNYILDTLTNGHVYKIQFTYDVYGETGDILASGLTSTKYVYVGTESDATKDHYGINNTGIKDTNNTYTYADEIYTTGVPSTGLSIGFKQNKNAPHSVQVTNAVLKDPNGAVVNGYTIEPATTETGAENRNVYISSAGKDGSFTLKPYTIAEGVNLQKETYVYKKDADGKVIYKNGLPEIDHVMTTEEYLAANPGKPSPTWLKNGNYTLETTIVSSDGTQTIKQNIHLYEEFGLENLFNNEVEKNYTAASLANPGYFATYSDALNKVAQFVLAAKATGTAFTDDDLDSDISVINSEYGKLYGTVTNKYAQYYSYLSGVIGNLQLNSSGADALAAALDEMIGITKYEKTELTLSDGNTVTFNMPIEHEYYEIDEDDTGLPFNKFIGQVDYTGAAFETFRKARNTVQDLIARDKNYTGVNFSVTQEEYNASSVEEQQSYNQKIYAWINSTGKNIGSTEEKIAIAKLNLAWERLQNYKIETSGKMNVLANVVFDDNSPYYAAYDGIDSYAKQGAKNFRNAMEFALKIYQGEIDSEYVTLDMVIEAVNNVVYYYKRLVEGADTSALAEAIEEYALNSGKEATYFDEGGAEVTGEIPYLDDSWTYFEFEDAEEFVPHFNVNPETAREEYAGKWDFDSYANFIAVLAEACEAYYEKDWAVSQQEDVDAITEKLYQAMADLKGNAEVEEPESYSIDVSLSSVLEEIKDVPADQWADQKMAEIFDNYDALDEDTGKYIGFTLNEELYWNIAADEYSMFEYAENVADVEIDNESVDPDERYELEYDDKTVPVKGYLVGLAPEMDEEDLQYLLESTAKNCKVVVEASNSKGVCGTGTKVFVTSPDGSEVYDAYVCVYRSDMNGDGRFRTDDITAIKEANAGFNLFDWEDLSNLHKAVAIDMNGNGKIDVDDITCLLYHQYGLSDGTINWADIWQPAGNKNIGLYPDEAFGS